MPNPRSTEAAAALAQAESEIRAGRLQVTPFGLVVAKRSIDSTADVGAALKGSLRAGDPDDLRARLDVLLDRCAFSALGALLVGAVEAGGLAVRTRVVADWLCGAVLDVEGAAVALLSPLFEPRDLWLAECAFLRRTDSPDPDALDERAVKRAVRMFAADEFLLPTDRALGVLAHLKSGAGTFALRSR